MAQLSICMPSNRNLEQSQRAIETALAFCEMRDAVLIVADNSGDADKAAYWHGRSPRLVYIPDAPLDPNENAMLTLRAAETPFVIPIGDDDEIHADPTLIPLDLATLDPDVIGVKPMTQLFAPGTDLDVRRAYAVDADTPGARLRQFFGVHQGDNTAFYSAFRTEPYLGLREFFVAHHPTRGSYCDWAMAMAFFLSGKLLFDPSIVFRYNLSAWVTQSAIDASTDSLYARVGLSEHHEQYNSLLQALDLFVFASRRNSGLSRLSLPEVQGDILFEMLDLGFSQVLRFVEPASAIAEVARKGLSERNPTVKYLHGAAVMDLYTPGLKAKYIAFLRAAST